jgi:hypothetical protein
VKLTSLLHLVAMLRMSGAISPLPHMFSWRPQGAGDPTPYLIYTKQVIDLQQKKKRHISGAKCCTGNLAVLTKLKIARFVRSQSRLQN